MTTRFELEKTAGNDAERPDPLAILFIDAALRRCRDSAASARRHLRDTDRAVSLPKVGAHRSGGATRSSAVPTRRPIGRVSAQRRVSEAAATPSRLTAAPPRRRGHLTLLTALVACALTAPAAASAQDARPVAPNEQVRLRSARATGVFTVADTGTQTLVLRNHTGAEIVVPLAEVEQLEVHRGRSGRKGAAKGAALGFLAGGVGGVVMGFADGDDPPGILSFSAPEKATMAGLVFGGLGAIGGAIIGGVVGAGSWQQVPLRRSLVIAPSANGVGIRYAF